MKRTSRQGSEQARRNFPTLVERAARGEATLITKHGKPYAALVPASVLSSRSGGADLRSLRGTGKGLWGKSARRTIARMRDEWR